VDIPLCPPSIEGGSGFPEAPFGKGGLRGILKNSLGEGGDRGIDKRFASIFVNKLT